jgi:fermentation-respiration switch protein FrsA (DUF1100 family)
MPVLNLLAVALLAALAVYAAVVVWTYAGQRRRIFRPQRELLTRPDAHGYAYEDVFMRSADGVRLHGWFVFNPQARGTLVYCHGNTGNISHCMDSLALFHGLGFSVLLFDYRGYGLSEGRPDERGMYLDVEAAWEYLLRERGHAPHDIVVLGRSLGGAVASWLATRHAPRALVVESTFTSLPAVAADHHPLLPARLLTRYRYPVAEHLRAARCPVLVVHSRGDETVPFRHAQRLFEIAPEPKALLEIGGRHGDGFLSSGAVYEEGLAEFIARYER